MKLLFASDFGGLAWVALWWFLKWAAIAAALGFGSAAVLVVHRERNRFWWTGIPFTIGWALLIWIYLQVSQR